MFEIHFHLILGTSVSAIGLMVLTGVSLLVEFFFLLYFFIFKFQVLGFLSMVAFGTEWRSKS